MSICSPVENATACTAAGGTFGWQIGIRPAIAMWSRSKRCLLRKRCRSPMPALARSATTGRGRRCGRCSRCRFPRLMFQAQRVHRVHFDPAEVQISTLLSIKTGGCPEDCAYCPQSRALRHRRRSRKADEPRRRAQRGARGQGRRRLALLHGRGLAQPEGPRPRAGLRHGGRRQGARPGNLRHARHADRRAGAAAEERRPRLLQPQPRHLAGISTATSSPRAPIRTASTRSSTCARPASMSAAAASSAWARGATTASA